MRLDSPDDATSCGALDGHLRGVFALAMVCVDHVEVSGIVGVEDVREGPA